MSNLFLPGVPVEHVLDRLDKAGGNEVGSGKLAHPESSAALAVNAFGWFIDRPKLLPALPGTTGVGEVQRVEVEYCAKFPWSHGRHPWLDAAVLTETHLIGVESKRFEPFRDTKSVSLSSAYDRPVWGDNMKRYSKVCDDLRQGALRFKHLDAAQLVKHGFGLVTEGKRIGRLPVLYYIFAEPNMRAGQNISCEQHARHREEIASFTLAVAGDEVAFASASYHEWLDRWYDRGELAEHATSLRLAFCL